MPALAPVVPAATPSPAPRRVVLPRWMDARLLVGVLLVLVSIAAAARLVAHARHTVAVVAVKHDLAAGTTLTAGELELVQVRLSGHARSSYATGIAAVAGKQLNRPVDAGELLPMAALRAPDPARTVVVPLPPDAAPALSPGQRVSIWLTAPACSARLLLDDVPVQSVHENRTASFTAAGGQTVVLQVAPDLAARVMAALAIDDVQLRGVRVEGASAAASGAAPSLPDLADCTKAGS